MELFGISPLCPGIVLSYAVAQTYLEGCRQCLSCLPPSEATPATLAVVLEFPVGGDS